MHYVDLSFKYMRRSDKPRGAIRVYILVDDLDESINSPKDIIVLQVGDGIDDIHTGADSTEHNVQFLGVVLPPLLAEQHWG